MELEFSNRIAHLKPSAIREILKVTQDPSVISFSAGNPAPESFPAAEMASIAAELFEKKAASALQYGVSEGYTPLRELTSARLKEKFNVGRSFDDLIVTSGGQQVIEMTAKIFLNEGDTIICEDPSFVGALNAFRSYNVKLVGIKSVSELEGALRANPHTKLIYTIPTFQNPTGNVMSLSDRRKMLELAEKYNVMILEDSPYLELRFAGEYVPPIKSMDEKGIVIYSGSYSKVLSPGIRLGFVCARSEIVSKLTVAKQVSDVHTNLFFQMIAAEYLKRYDIDAHIQKICAIYREKAAAMTNAMKKSFDARVKYELPQGGLFLWCTLPDGCDGMELCRLCSAKKVAAVPGVAFSVDDSIPVPTFRLNFSLPSYDEINTGIARMGEAIDEYLPTK